jgi:endonuclease/exonuclease/phosphatase family metal-dependent hydrolase
MSRGRVLWLEAETHDKTSVSVVNMHQATAGRIDLQKQVNYHMSAMIDAAPGQRRVMGGDFNAAVSRHGYAETMRPHFERVDKQFQDFVKSTGRTLIDSVAHTRRDLVRKSSASLDHIIAWNLTIESSSEVHWVGSNSNDHASISCTVG